jgi:hypothetical protein
MRTAAVILMSLTRIISIDLLIGLLIDLITFVCYSFSVVYMCFFSYGDVNHNFQENVSNFSLLGQLFR